MHFAVGQLGRTKHIDRDDEGETDSLGRGETFPLLPRFAQPPPLTRHHADRRQVGDSASSPLSAIRWGHPISYVFEGLTK